MSDPEYHVRYDVLDDLWEVVDEDDCPEAGPFESEQDAYDYIESFLE